MSVPVLAVVILMATMGLSEVSCLPSKERNMEYRKTLFQQKKELDRLKCEPRTTMVHVEEELEFHDSLGDEDFLPRVVSANRCIESCSFCGNSALGVPRGRCQPVPESIVKRPVLAYYFKGNERHFQVVMVAEHTACKCSSSKHDQEV